MSSRLSPSSSCIHTVSCVRGSVKQSVDIGIHVSIARLYNGDNYLVAITTVCLQGVEAVTRTLSQVYSL